MVQMFTSLPTQWTNRIFCYYTNTSRQLQIARITDVPGWRFEQLIFPGQRLIFEAIPEALLKIYPGTAASLVPLQQIPCAELQVHDTSIAARDASRLNNAVEL